MLAIIYRLLDKYRNSYSRELARTVFPIVLFVFELAALSLAFWVGQVLAPLFGVQQSSPLNIVLLVDCSLIVVAAMLAEIAAPSLKTETSFEKLISWSFTSLSVAITTLAPVASYAAEIISRNPEQFKDQSNFFILILRPGESWDPDNLRIYRILVCLVAAVDLVVATLAAKMLCRISQKALQRGSATEQSKRPWVSYLVLFVSIYLFCIYIFFMHEWDRSSFVIGPKARDLVPLLWCIAVLSGITILMLGRLKWFWRAERLRRDGYNKGAQFGKSIFGDLLLLIIALVFVYLLWRFTTDSTLSNTTITHIGELLLKAGAPAGISKYGQKAYSENL